MLLKTNVSMLVNRGNPSFASAPLILPWAWRPSGLCLLHAECRSESAKWVCTPSGFCAESCTCDESMTSSMADPDAGSFQPPLVDAALPGWASNLKYLLDGHSGFIRLEILGISDLHARGPLSTWPLQQTHAGWFPNEKRASCAGACGIARSGEQHAGRPHAARR